MIVWMSKVSAIIPTLWKAKEFTDHLVDVLIEDESVGEIIIIDNAPADFFYDNEKVLYISTHQYPYYPGTGGNNEKGKFNNVLNIPLPAGTNSEEYLNAYEHVLKKLKEILYNH